MSRATPTLRDFAKFLVAQEADGKGTLGTTNRTTFRACEKLRSHLTLQMGSAGFRSLLGRALALAGREIRWLRVLQVKADGTLEETLRLEGDLDAGELFKGRVALLTQLLGLLVVFIGEELTVRLVREIWPEVPVGRMKFANGVNK